MDTQLYTIQGIKTERQIEKTENKRKEMDTQLYTQVSKFVSARKPNYHTHPTHNQPPKSKRRKESYKNLRNKAPEKREVEWKKHNKNSHHPPSKLPYLMTNPTYLISLT